jgi:hypothetical protein
MQDDGQLELACQPDLLLVEPDLALLVQSGDKKSRPISPTATRCGSPRCWLSNSRSAAISDSCAPGV